MTKIFVSLLFLCANISFAAQAVDFNLFYRDAGLFESFDLKDLSVELPLAKPSKVLTQKRNRRYVSLSGYLTLNGSGFMPSGGGYTTIYVSGWVTLWDSSREYTTNSVYIDEPCSFWAKENQYISENVYINKSVPVYKDGKYVGTANIYTSVRVSGWTSSNYINLQGGGYISASAYVDDENK